MGNKNAGNSEKNREKEIIISLCDLREQITALRKKIEVLEKKVARLEKEKVSDVVRGGYGGTQHFGVTGFPSAEYGTTKRTLALAKMRLSLKEEMLHDRTLEVTEYLVSVEQDDLRRMLEMRYLDERLWKDVAKKLTQLFPGKVYTAQSCRKANERFFSS